MLSTGTNLTLQSRKSSHSTLYWTRSAWGAYWWVPKLCHINISAFSLQVPDGGALNLVSKQSSFYNLSILPEKTDKSHKYETLNLSKFSSASPPLSRATSPLNHDHDGGLKVSPDSVCTLYTVGVSQCTFNICEDSRILECDTYWASSSLFKG
jgi:hypothetical protein